VGVSVKFFECSETSVAYTVVMAFEFDFGIFGTQLLEDFGELALFLRLLLDAVQDIGAVKVMGRDDLLPEWFVPQHSSSVSSTLRLLVWVRRTQFGNVVKKNLLGLLKVGLDTSKAIYRALDAMSLHIDDMKAGDELGVLVANEIFGMADLLFEIVKVYTKMRRCL
jgi:hypothetical protein